MTSSSDAFPTILPFSNPVTLRGVSGEFLILDWLLGMMGGKCLGEEGEQRWDKLWAPFGKVVGHEMMRLLNF